MKIRVTVTVDVNPEVYREAYGVEDVREDVRRYVPQLVDSWLVENGFGEAVL